MSLARSLSWYTATGLLTSGIPFFLLPVFTHYLTTSDYGIMSSIVAYVVLLSPIIIFGIPSLFSTDFHRLNRVELRRKSGVWLGLPLVLGGGLIGLFWVMKDLLAGPLAIPVNWVPAIPLLALLGFIPQWAEVMLRMADRPHHFASYQGGQAVLLLGMALFFVVVLDMHWEGRLWSMLIAGVLASVVGLLILRPYLSITRPKKEDVCEVMKFGAGLVPHSVFSQLVRQSDRLFILHFIGLAATGEFAVGWQIASIMLVLLSTFNQAWTPYLFQRLSNANEYDKLTLVKHSYLIAVGFCILFLLLNIASPLIFSLLIADKFHDAQKYVPFITLGYLFMGFYLLVTDYIFYTKKTYILSILTTTNAIINIVLNYFFIQKFGAIGVTYAFAVSSFMVAAAAWLLAQKCYPMPWIFWVSRRGKP